MMVGFFSEWDDYKDFRCKTVAKDVGGEPQVCDIDCERLSSLGVRYCTQEEYDAFMREFGWVNQYNIWSTEDS